MRSLLPNGDTYENAHRWIASHGCKTGKCSECGESGPTHWANVDHQYRRVLEDWIELCAACHGRYDSERGFRKKKPSDRPIRLMLPVGNSKKARKDFFDSLRERQAHPSDPPISA